MTSSLTGHCAERRHGSFWWVIKKLLGSSRGLVWTRYMKEKPYLKADNLPSA